MATRFAYARVISLGVVLASFLLFFQAAYAQAPAHLRGGPHGVVKSASGEPLEGIMVQLIAQKNAIRTTVYSNADGRYEFPKLESGTYTLRIARPREFHPFAKEKLEINGSPELPEITLTRVTNGALLPPLPQIAAQMTGSIA